MSVRAPSIFRKAAEDPVQSALEAEVLAEKAGALSRQTRKLEQALARLAAVDEGDSKQLQRRKAEAAEAVWSLTIQRDLCGLADHGAFFDLMGVPKSLRLLAGPMPPD